MPEAYWLCFPSPLPREATIPAFPDYFRLQSQPSSTPVLKAALDVVHVTIHAVHSIPGYALEYSALQTMVVVLSEGLHYLATSRFLQQYSLEALDKLPLLAFRTMSEGQVLTFFTDSIGLALGWSTPASPIRGMRLVPGGLRHAAFSTFSAPFRLCGFGPDNLFAFNTWAQT